MGSTLEREVQHMEGIKACRHGRRNGSLESVSSKMMSVFSICVFSIMTRVFPGDFIIWRH